MTAPCVIVLLGSLAAAAVFTGCAASGSGTPPDRGEKRVASPEVAMASAFHFRPAESPRGAWVVLLPGASGLTIFDDEEHYFRAAEALNASGFDALVVDYKAAYKAAADAPRVPTGDKIAWVTERAVEWGRSSGKIGAAAPGAVVAWSLGAEGLWPLLADGERVRALNVRAAAAYYPSNEDGAAIRTEVPLLILTGEADGVTEAKGIRAMVSRAGSPRVTLRVYPGALHGFDVASITTARTVRLMPLIGPSATFGYDAGASGLAAEELAGFLGEWVR